MSLKSGSKQKIQIAQETPFESEPGRPNGFPSFIEDSQEAIEYAKQYAEGFPRAGIPCIYNGTLSNNDWISYSNLTPDVPIPWAVSTKIHEITWANKSSRSDRSFDLEIYKIVGTIQSLVTTLSVSNSTYHYGYWSGLSITFNSGEALRMRYKDTGKNCSDLVVVLWFSRVI